MPPTNVKSPFVMPKPAAVVVWKNAPAAEENFAIVTHVGRHAISLIVFPSESRVGIPKDSVRHVADPRNAALGISGDYGVWDYTEESKQLHKLLAESQGQTSDSK